MSEDGDFERFMRRAFERAAGRPVVDDPPGERDDDEAEALSAAQLRTAAFDGEGEG